MMAGCGRDGHAVLGVEEHDAAHRANGHRTRCCDLREPDAHDARLGGETGRERATAGDPSDIHWGDRAQRARIPPQRLAVRPAGCAAAQVTADRAVMPPPVRLRRDRQPGRGARQFGCLAMGPQPDARPRDQTTDCLFVRLEQGRDLLVGVPAQLTHQQRRSLTFGKLADPR
jgi:hypothetical protein